MKGDNVTVFKNDDDAYRRWLQSQTQGYVLNVNSAGGTSDMRLHYANCSWLPTIGNLTLSYYKVCSPNKEVILQWASREKGVIPEPCDHCRP